MKDLSFFEKRLGKKFGTRLLFDVLFKNKTTFHIGGKIKYFIEPQSVKELLFVIKLCKKFSVKYFILGGGSNILAKDVGYSGVVISTLALKRLIIKGKKVRAFCGVRLVKLVVELKEKGLSNLEWMIGIPGTVGGAVLMNAGAFESEICQSLKSITFFDGKRIRTISAKCANFSYRNSIFRVKSNWVIISAQFFVLQKTKKEIQEKIDFFVKKRKKEQNVGHFSAGSVFKKVDNVSAAYYIDKANLKGKRIGDAEISQVHAGYIVNLGQASFEDVQILIDFILNSVYNIFNKKLETEIIIVGD